ncbi:hypothetical protein W97_01735 [Coniosporium apollinis CBS 100218]|uniref:Xylanolytic transcriptional activator regulatory domain-containing protein n=1 Tax=Coniosporium apollinis (strain CBS 100218) TaxID=1168221 RepID=R7YKS2_CONA1|nr:uncharacterized protein W97_01735 [Coniosporium apollinis CBS 100218]EON62512.1 hypothetical protein W97_01735 [Coniosporium apollinis CBS 100218]
MRQGTPPDSLPHDARSLDPSRRQTPDLGGTEFAGSYLGPTSAISWLQRAWRRLGQAHEEFPTHLNGEVSNNASVFTHGDKLAPTVSPNDDAFELPPRAEALLTRYFEFASPTYRFLHRQTVTGWLEQVLDAAPRVEKKVSAARQAVVYMVLANGSLYHVISGDAPTPAATDDRLKSERLFVAAQKKLSAEVGPPTLESVQARFAQCLYLLSTSRPNQAWFTCGTAVQLSMALGLHRKRAMVELSSLVVRECQRRTFWCLYTLDKYLSVMFGRPRLLQDEDIDQDFPQPVNDEDLTPSAIRIPGRDDCLMDAPIFHAELALIVSKASREQYSPGSKTPDQRFALVSTHNLSLEQWKTRLPPFLSGAIRPSSLIPILRRQSTVLTLAYAHAVMLVNRPLLLSNFSKPRRGGVTQSPLFQHGIELCVEAAQDVAHMVLQFVEEQQMFEAFWYTQYIAFNALSIIYLYIIQCHRHRTLSDSQTKILNLAETCQQHLAEATRTNAPSLRYAIILEELRLEVHRQLDHVSPPQQALGTNKDTTVAAAQEFNVPMGGSTFQPNLAGSVIIQHGGQTPGSGLAHDAFEDTMSADTDGIDWNLDFWPQLDSLPLSYNNWFDEVSGDLGDAYPMSVTGTG